MGSVPFIIYGSQFLNNAMIIIKINMAKINTSLKIAQIICIGHVEGINFFMVRQ